MPRLLPVRMMMLLACWCGAFTQCALAGIHYSFDPVGISGQNLSVDIMQGGTASLPVYLVFTGPDATALLTEHGLFSSDVQLKRIGLPPSQPVGIANAQAVTSNAAFDEPVGALVTFVSSGDVDLFQSIKFSDTAGVQGNALGASGRAVLLGSFLFTSGTILGEKTIFQAQDFAGQSDTVTFTNNNVLDGLIGTAQVTFTTAKSTVIGGGGGSVPLPQAWIAGAAAMFMGSIVQIARRAGLSPARSLF